MNDEKFKKELENFQKKIKDELNQIEKKIDKLHFSIEDFKSSLNNLFIKALNFIDKTKLSLKVIRLTILLIFFILISIAKNHFNIIELFNLN